MKKVFHMSFFVLYCTVLYSQNIENEIIGHLLEFEKVPQNIFDDESTQLEVLSIAKENTVHPDGKVRYRSYRLVLDIGIKSESAEIQSKVLNILIGATIDEEHYVRERFHDAFSIFPKNLYSEEFKLKLVEFIRNEQYTNSTHVLLAGYLDLSGTKNRLEEIASGSSIDTKYRISYKSKLKSFDFFAHLALARLGEREHVKYVIESFEKEEKESLVFFHLELVGYVKQEEIVGLLATLINSEEEIGGGDVLRESYANRTLDCIVTMFENFPIKKNKAGLYSIEEIELARAAMKNNQSNLVINRDIW